MPLFGSKMGSCVGEIQIRKKKESSNSSKAIVRLRITLYSASEWNDRDYSWRI